MDYPPLRDLIAKIPWALSNMGIADKQQNRMVTNYILNLFRAAEQDPMYINSLIAQRVVVEKKFKSGIDLSNRLNKKV